VGDNVSNKNGFQDENEREIARILAEEANSVEPKFNQNLKNPYQNGLRAPDE
jgi:hypothetical protein